MGVSLFEFADLLQLGAKLVEFLTKFVQLGAGRLFDILPTRKVMAVQKKNPRRETKAMYSTGRIYQHDRNLCEAGGPG
jgi:hypothetical protein